MNEQETTKFARAFGKINKQSEKCGCSCSKSQISICDLEQKLVKVSENLIEKIENELERHLVDANDVSTMNDYQARAGFNKGLIEAGRILARCISRGDFNK